MKRIAGALRWSWPALLLGLLVLVPWAIHETRTRPALHLVIVDKTVPFRNWLEHRSLYWLVDHLGVVKRDGSPYERASDYLGAYPPPVPGDPPERTRDLAAEDLVDADLLYLADTYGVYERDLESKEKMLAALERSPRIYGGTTFAEAEAASGYVDRGGLAIAEFNTLGSPTEGDARRLLEETFGVRWTRWIGRYFPRLEDRDEVPEWLRRVWEREWKERWRFEGPGYVLTRDDIYCEVLRVGTESASIGLTIERDAPHDPALREARGKIPYPYWFDVVEAAPGTETLASFQWSLTESGAARLGERSLPMRFPAIVRRDAPGGGRTYYFAGDFADNPMREGRVPFAGYLSFRKWFEGAKLAPSEEAFYWRFYAPMMDAILSEARARREGGKRPL